MTENELRNALAETERGRLALYNALVVIDRAFRMAKGYRRDRKLIAERQCLDAARDAAAECVAAGFVSVVDPDNDPEAA